MSRKPRIAPAASPAQPQAPEVKQMPKDLEEKAKAVQAIANVYDLLNLGVFSGHLSQRNVEAQKFIAALHKQMLEELLAHPEAKNFIINQEVK